MKWVPFAFICATTACAGEPVPPPSTARSVSAASAPFASYHTFSFANADAPRAGYEVSPHSLEVQQHLARLVEAGLVERGYLKSAEGGDFMVKLASGTALRTSPLGERNVTRTPQGFIGIDVYDKATGAEVWQSTAFAEISLETIDDELLQRGVTRMLASFPKQGAATASSHELSALASKASN